MERIRSGRAAQILETTFILPPHPSGVSVPAKGLRFEVAAIPSAIGRAQHHLHGSSSQEKPPDQVELR